MKNALIPTQRTGEATSGLAALGLNTIVQESHPQTGIDLTYISQSGDTSAPPAYAATGGDRYVGLDQFGRVDDQFYVNPSTVTSPTDRFQYSYDLDGNVLYKDVTEMGGTAATYSQLYHASGGLDSAAYDGQNRLTSFEQGTLTHTNAGNGSVLDTVASPTLTEGFTLDSVGNWDTFSNSGTGGETRTFNAQNEITNNSGSTTPTYDYDGNMTKNDGGATLVYNAWNQLVSYNGSVAEYQYLPGGQRASATTCSTGNTQFSYFSTDWQDLEDDLPPAGSGGSVQATTYVWGLENVNELVERDSSAGVRLYAQHDANMDVTALLTTGGTVAERFGYDPYGVGTVLSASWAATSDAYNWTYRWQGGLYDLTTGLYSFQRRDYSPTLGTWLENDPAGYIDGPNTYQGMLGAPIEKTDPLGLDPSWDTTTTSSGSTVIKPPGGGTITVNGDLPDPSEPAQTGSNAPDPYGSNQYWRDIAAAGGINTPAGQILAAQRARMWDTQGQLANDLAGTTDPAARQAILAAIANAAQNWNNPPPAAAPPPDDGGILGGAINLLGQIWGAPNSLIGLALGLGGVLRGGPWPTFGNNAIQFVGNPIMNYFLPNPAITLGNVVNYNAAVTDPTTGSPVSPTTPWPTYDGSSTIEMGIHEEGHTYQSELLGPLFLPAYLIGQLVAPINPFEQAADNFALANGPHSP